jgi:hypothetical protein
MRWVRADGHYGVLMIFTMVVVGLVLVFVIGAIAWKSMKGRGSRA